MTQKTDRLLTLLFVILTLVFFGVCATSESFVAWAFERHQNQWSWYIRPLFLIPFCFFAFKQSYSGVFGTILALFTSMFWFNAPETVAPNVQEFLAFEVDWLFLTPWDFQKIMLTLLVPVSFFLLALACWKRSLWMGLGVMALMATGKIIWSVYNAGSSGNAVIIPALVGLVLCMILVFVGFRRMKRN